MLLSRFSSIKEGRAGPKCYDARSVTGPWADSIAPQLPRAAPACSHQLFLGKGEAKGALGALGALGWEEAAAPLLPTEP